MNEDNRPILIIDSLNLFIRNYVVNPSMTSNGIHCGGIVGYLNSIRYLNNKFSPKQIIIAWENKGSAKRRAIYPDYKAGRKPVKPNRFYDEEIPDSEENKVWQTIFLTKIMSNLPICQIYVDDCEADDVIGYLCKYKLKGQRKLIVSSDKDMYQLLDDSTQVYSPIRRVIIDSEYMKSEYNIIPENFVLCKAICGDSSDNIPGVKRVGFKSLVKRVKILSNDTEISLDDIFEYCKNEIKISKIKLYSNIVNDKELVRRNLRLMNLDTAMLSFEQIKKIDYAIDTFKPIKDKITMIRMLINIGIQNINVDSIFYSMNSIKG
jgi:DNA polymerase-1